MPTHLPAKSGSKNNFQSKQKNKEKQPMKNILILSVLFLSAVAHAEDVPPGLKSEAEAGVVLTSGNTETSTVSAKEATKYTWGKNNFSFDANFLTSSNRGNQQAYQWGLGVRYERELNAAFGVFLGQLLQSDKYQNIDQRYATDVGGKYTFDKYEGFNWFAEFGYRFTRENYPYGFKNINFLRAYNEVEKSWTKTFSVKWWIEYLPNLSQWKAYQLNSELSISTVLTDIFSLKSAYLVRYYNEPPVGITQTTDTTFTTSLVAKF
jgi:putative salt-induced outer membrane protein